MNYWFRHMSDHNGIYTGHYTKSVQTMQNVRRFSFHVFELYTPVTDPTVRNTVAAMHMPDPVVYK